MRAKRNLENSDWRSIWAGAWTHIDCSDWGEFYTSDFQVSGKPFVSQAVFVFENGKVSAWVPEADVQDFSHRVAAEHVTEEEIQGLADGMRRATDSAMRYMEEGMEGDVTPELYEGYLASIRRYYASAIPVKYFLEGVDPDSVEKYLPLLEPARLYGESVFTKSIEFDQSLAVRISEKVGIEPRYLLCLLRDELLAYLRGGALPRAEELKNRYEASALVFSGLGSVLYTGSDVVTITQALLPKASADVLKGTIAFKGYAKGIARIILDPSVVAEFNEGAILVTKMTRPEYLPLMQKAAAIVTDAGGVLSHAAISARELQKPCVIGTKTATQTFVDGEEIEVDADAGIVRKS